jgi:hypothetical protein
VSAKSADHHGCGARARRAHNASLNRAFCFAAAVLCTGCGVARADDLSEIRAVRSLAAEAAQVIRLETQHRVTAPYAREMKSSAREELRKEAESATAPRVKATALQAMAAVNANNAQALEAIVRRLFALEGPHGRAD